MKTYNEILIKHESQYNPVPIVRAKFELKSIYGEFFITINEHQYSEDFLYEVEIEHMQTNKILTFRTNSSMEQTSGEAVCRVLGLAGLDKLNPDCMWKRGLTL